MSDEIKINRAPQQPSLTSEIPAAGRGGSKMPWFILAAVIVVLAVLGILFRDNLFGAKDNKSVSQINNGAYQAVFLTNGQVYFGKMTKSDDDYTTLTDIYYLQVVQPPLQGTPQAGQPQADAQQQPQISLVKLGNELHGPIDEMHITKAQILFYEDLKADGNVVKAIEQYKANPQGNQPAQ